MGKTVSSGILYLGNSSSEAGLTGVTLGLGHNFTMWDRVDRWRRQAQDCKDRASEARDPIDGDAWLKLAEEWLALASSKEGSEQRPSASE